MFLINSLMQTIYLLDNNDCSTVIAEYDFPSTEGAHTYMTSSEPDQPYALAEDFELMLHAGFRHKYTMHDIVHF